VARSRFLVLKDTATHKGWNSLPTGLISSTNALQRIAAVQRYVLGYDESGYQLCHPRFHECLVSGHMRPNEQRPYRAALINWCESAWSDSESFYPASHVIAQLADQRKLARLPERAGITARMLAILIDRGFSRSKASDAGIADRIPKKLSSGSGAAVADPWPDAMIHTRRLRSASRICIRTRPECPGSSRRRARERPRPACSLWPSSRRTMTGSACAFSCRPGFVP
jgi:hypothetical protein